jgi:hypothetical protein
MANREHLAKIKKGVAAWNDWRKTNKEIVPHLSGADLYGADLSMANLSTAQLGGSLPWKNPAEIPARGWRSRKLH